MASATPQPDTPSPDHASVGGQGAHTESAEAFFACAAEALGIAWTNAGGLLELSFEHREHPTWPKPYRVKFSITGDSIEKPARRQVSTQEGAAWLWKLAQIEQGALIARPAAQPAAVHEFASRLFEAYQVDGGQIQLAGCSLTQTPFIRVSTFDEGEQSLEHRFFTASGSAVSEDLLEELGLADAVPMGDHPSSYTTEEVSQLLRPFDTNVDRFVAATVIGAKWAEGALQFNIGEQCAQVEFSGWTASLEAPPFHCMASNTDTYHLAAIDDGRIVAVEAIAICEQSGEQVLETEMVTCSVTGKRVGPAQVKSCPVTGKPALEATFAACAACGQPTSPLGLSKNVCRHCTSMQPQPADDQYVAALLERFPALAAYGSFRHDHTHRLRRLEARGWSKRVMVTVCGETDDVLAVATRTRLSSWQQVPPADWPGVLGTGEGT